MIVHRFSRLSNDDDSKDSLEFTFSFYENAKRDVIKAGISEHDWEDDCVSESRADHSRFLSLSLSLSRSFFR